MFTFILSFFVSNVIFPSFCLPISLFHEFCHSSSFPSFSSVLYPSLSNRFLHLFVPFFLPSTPWSLFNSLIDLQSTLRDWITDRRNVDLIDPWLKRWASMSSTLPVIHFLSPCGLFVHSFICSILLLLPSFLHCLLFTLFQHVFNSFTFAYL